MPEKTVSANSADAIAAVVSELEGSTPEAIEGVVEAPAEAVEEISPDVEEGDPDGAEVLSEGDEEVVEEVKPFPVKEDPAVARSLAALARKEAALRERERVITERERTATITPQALEALRQQASVDPVAFYKALGIEKTAEIAAQLYYEEMGDKAPPEWRARKEAMATQRQVADLRKQLEQKNQEEFRMRQEGQARAFLLSKASSVPDEFPYLKAEAQDNPAAMADEMLRMTRLLGGQGHLAGLSDDEITNVVSQTIDADLKKGLERYERLYGKTKATTPVTAPKTPTTAKPVSKKVLASTTTTKPSSTPKTRREQLQEITRDLIAGKHKLAK